MIRSICMIAGARHGPGGCAARSGRKARSKIIMRKIDATLPARRAWHMILSDADNAADHAAVQRAASAATEAGHDRETAGWYAYAINHYLDRHQR